MKFFQHVEEKKRWLKIIPLGGTTDVTKNIYVYETPEEILVVDCGIGFPDSILFGIDAVLPDISYLLKNRERVKGILITHGHEDHFGALPYVLPDLNVPVYAAKLVHGFITAKLTEANLLAGSHLHLIDPDKGPFRIGTNYLIHPFRTTHSVPDSLGFGIETPAGLVVHVSDFKFDWTPVSGQPFDVATLAKISEKGVLLLASDCLGANNPGYTRSEREIEETFNRLFDAANHNQVFITTVSSNISRIQQAVNASLRHGRKIVLVGRSIVQNTEVARKLGYLKLDERQVVREEEAGGYPQEKLTYLITGCYAQPGSALMRVSEGDHRFIKLSDHSMVIFSADPIPGLYDEVDSLINKLTLARVHVLYSEIQEDLHVSGHGSRGDLETLAALVRPKYFMPIGGTPKFMRSYTQMVEEMGVNENRVFQLLEGESVVLENGQARRGERVDVNDIYIDGSKVGDVGEVVLRDRQNLAADGIVFVVVPVYRESLVFGNVSVTTRGFVYAKESGELLAKAKTLVEQVLAQHKDKLGDRSFIRGKVERELNKFLFSETARHPVILTEIVEV